MSEKIEPALSAEEWRSGIGAEVDDFGVVIGSDVTAYILDGTELHVATEGGHAVGGDDRPAALVALANAALPDSDPRKITRERIDFLRDCAERIEAEYGSAAPGSDPSEYTDSYANRLSREADALESYLPPE